MHFNKPERVEGDEGLFRTQFAAGWSAPDYDGDAHEADNCANAYNGVTQHYERCWVTNVGSDAESGGADERLGPHVHPSLVEAFGLASDGSNYTRVRRISRFVRW